MDPQWSGPGDLEGPMSRRVWKMRPNTPPSTVEVLTASIEKPQQRHLRSTDDLEKDALVYSYSSDAQAVMRKNRNR